MIGVCLVWSRYHQRVLKPCRATSQISKRDHQQTSASCLESLLASWCLQHYLGAGLDSNQNQLALDPFQAAGSIMAGMVQQAVEQSVLRVAKQLEDQIDSQLHKLEHLQDDDLERIRQRRVHELRQQQEKTKEWVAKGHGEYKEIFEEKEFFKEMKGEERMICHFYRDNWPCKVCLHTHPLHTRCLQQHMLMLMLLTHDHAL